MTDPARTASGLLEEWDLVADGPARRTHASVVQPVAAAGRPAYLKVADVHPETEHEALALQHRQGRGAVRLLRADPRRLALLLERLGPDDLTVLPVLDACEVVAGLYPDLHVAAPPQLTTLPAYVARWLPGWRHFPGTRPSRTGSSTRRWCWPATWTTTRRSAG